MGVRHTCAILEDGALTCWGADSYGALGNGDSDSADKYTPQPIATPADRQVTKVESGATHTWEETTRGNSEMEVQVIPSTHHQQM